MLDPIITTLSKYYQTPVAKPPLDPDSDKAGEKSDHDIVVMWPITNKFNAPARTKKIISYRPLPKSGIQQMGEWIVNENFLKIYSAETAHEKAELLQNLLMEKFNLFLP